MANDKLTSEPSPPPAPPPAEGKAALPAFEAGGAQPAAEKLDYKPVSSWAVAGAIVSFSVTALVLGGIILAVATDDSPLMPGWLVGAMTIGGAIVSFIAMRQIVSSEQTRTGMGLARWSLWLSILTGTGFFVFGLATRLALQNQANAFIMVRATDDDGSIPDTGFVPRLLDGCSDPVQFNCAFLLTVPERAGTDPKDASRMKVFDTPSKGMMPPMAVFRDNPMVRLVQGAMTALGDRDLVKIEPVSGVESCDFISPKGRGRGHYEVARAYKVTTPEIVKYFTLYAFSIEPSGPGERRKWYLGALPQEQTSKAYRTSLGVGLRALRNRAYDVLFKWNNGENNKLTDATHYEKLLPDRKQREGLLAGGPIEGRRGKLTIEPLAIDSVTPWDIVDGKVRIDYPVQMKMVGAPGTIYNLEGYVRLESKTPIDPPTYTDQSPDPGWTIRSINWVRIENLALKSK